MGNCHHHDLEISKRVIWIVLILNFIMFFVEITQGLEANSTSLIADSIDFLSDSFSYAITLYVMGKSLKMRASAAFVKAGLMMCLAVIVLAQGFYNITQSTVPEHVTMGWVGALALGVNLICAGLLYNSRGKDSNMQSIWLCSRNDAIGNLLILVAAGLVFFTESHWPDFIVALVITGLASSSALKIIAQAKKEYNHGSH